MASWASDESLGHGTPELFERYVLGALQAGEQQALEQHVGQCLPCGRLLAIEARRELALQEALLQLAPPLTAPATGQRPPVAKERPPLTPLLLAALAALTLVAGLGRQDPRLGAFAQAPAAALSFTYLPVATESGQAQQAPLLACLQLGEEALCPASPGGASAVAQEFQAGRSIERISYRAPQHEPSGALCRASDGTCASQSRRF